MTLNELNQLPPDLLKEQLFRCCGSTAWVEKMFAIFPVNGWQRLTAMAIRFWNECNEQDWLEAFSHHPAIGDLKGLQQKFGATARWASGEQSAVNEASSEVLLQLAEENKRYTEKFGYLFIVSATGKSAEQMLNMLQERIHHSPGEEMQVAMQEQLKITLLRLQKLITT